VPWVILLMLVSGLVLALAFPHTLWPGSLADRPPAWIAWLALAPLLWGVLGLPPRPALWGFWAATVLWYGLTLSWLRLFGALPWLLLVASLSLTPTLAAVLVRTLPFPAWSHPWVFGILWAAGEWVRGQGLLGFAWAELGASQLDGPLAPVIAVGGLPLLTLLLLGVIGTGVQWVRRVPLPRGIGVGTLVLLVGAALLGHHAVRAAVQRWHRQARAVTVTLVQPSLQRGLSPRALRTPQSLEQMQQRQQVALTLSRAALRRHPAPSTAPPLVVWSESSLPFQPTTPEIAEFCRRDGVFLLLGAPYYEAHATDGVFSYRPFNAAYLLTPGGRQERYAKVHLVPFGEFVPLRSFVERYYTVRANDLVPGAGWRPLRSAGIPIGVGICFESTFTDIARRYAAQDCGLLAFITNDAWFHQTAAVRQHYHQARCRALETGLPVVRVASTGISGIISPSGRSLTEIPVYARGTRTLRLARGVAGTPYTRGGWLCGPALLALAGVLLVWGVRLRRRRRLSRSRAEERRDSG
jgi:apolipoprotein N-acyltransferase